MLYFLKAKKRVDYDSYDAFVIEANTEEDARAIAQSKRGDETYDWSTDFKDRKDIPFWTSEEYSSCVLLTELQTKPGEIVIASFNAG